MSSDEEDISGEEVSSEEEEQQVVVKKKRKSRKKKKKKDPNKPKRNMTAFFLYSNANRERVKAENPEAKFGDIAKILSSEFKSLDARERSQWDDLAEKDKERYVREMEDYVPPSDDSSEDEKPRKKKKDPNAPKRFSSAFFIYSNTFRATIKEQNPEASFGDIAKIISAQFKALSATQRAKYDKLAVQDRARYDREMASYVPPEESSEDEKPRKKKKKKKDPNAPKRFQSAFFVYSNAMRATVKEQNPEASFGDIARIISAQFKALSPAQRAKYDKLAVADRARYEREMAAYKGGM